MALVAERAGISRATLGKVEKGDGTVSMGTFASVLFVLVFVHRIETLADLSEDETGRLLELEQLPKRIRRK